MRIHGRTFMVTGGGSGRGAATVKALLDRGARIIVADINEEAGETLASGKDEAFFLRTDVTDEEASERAAIDAARSAFGGLNGLVNCAGVALAIKVIARKGVHPLDSFAKGRIPPPVSRSACERRYGDGSPGGHPGGWTQGP